MNEEFQQALRAGDLDPIRRCPKADLHNHGWAGCLNEKELDQIRENSLSDS
jgi:hypothetical protein